MNLSIALFSLLMSLLTFNWNDEKISTVEIIKNETDSIKPIEELNLTKAFVLGKFNYKTDSTFIKVNVQHAAKTVYLKKVVYAAFLKMHKAAQKDDIQLVILSGTRNFDEQKAIWERKWMTYSNLEPIQRARKILEYSSMPSSSRHHWGTDLDLNSLSNSYFSSEKGKAIYDWLILNANDFGFYQVYTTKEKGRTGYNLEKWHWSYLPLANQYLEFYNSNITIDDINGFKGFEIAKELHIIEDYVNGISQQVKEYN
ncbi:M15 family metallopeptidase [Winogradskyella helgolandensis]|uniref:M15 family metallopeptidase n=1 Tax=Winogradskyella helgolandensis TaxID=2697010 RepID=UPI0015B9DAD6|nr:M15 family metallopeptidase [Winogradskyella helgolandensis]